MISKNKRISILEEEIREIYKILSNKELKKLRDKWFSCEYNTYLHVWGRLKVTIPGEEIIYEISSFKKMYEKLIELNSFL